MPIGTQCQSAHNGIPVEGILGGRPGRGPADTTERSCMPVGMEAGGVEVEIVVDRVPAASIRPPADPVSITAAQSHRLPADRPAGLLRHGPVPGAAGKNLFDVRPHSRRWRPGSTWEDGLEVEATLPAVTATPAARSAPDGRPSRLRRRCRTAVLQADQAPMGLWGYITGGTTVARDQAKTAMTAAEIAELGRMEAAVAAALPHVEAVGEAGKALARIRDEQLFRSTDSTWERYLLRRWSLSRRRADQLVNFYVSTVAIEEVARETGTVVPEVTEHTVRQLAGLAHDEKLEVVREAAAAGGGTITGKAIRKAAASRKAGRRPAVPRPHRERIPGGTVTIEVNAKGAAAGLTVEAALEAALAQVRSRRGAAA